MPARGDRNAPQFDSKKPNELRRYFTDLEFLLTRATVTDNGEMKKHATRFLSVDDQEVWETLSSFADNAKTYAEFKADVLKLYAGNDEDRRFSLSDLDALVGHYSRVGILSKDDLTRFYCEFLRITSYLVAKNRLSESEQSRSFLRAMQPDKLLVAVNQRLQIKKPDNHPEDPYTLADLYEAAQFAMAGPIGSTLLPALPSTSASPATIDVKPDPGITALVSTMTEILKVFATRETSHSTGDGSGSTNNAKRPRPDGCGYCSELDHFINACQHVLEEIKAGLCRRNADGRVVLPNGAFIPRAIAGNNLRARFQEWHKQNPGQLAAQLLVGVAAGPVSSPSASTTTASTLTFTEDDRIESLKLELTALQTRRQEKRALAARNNNEEPDRTIPPPTAPTPASAAPAAPALPTPPIPAQNIPQHPFSNARDAAYAPPQSRNFGVPVQKPAAYRTTAPIYNEKDAKEVSHASLDAPVTITQR
ncbi:hypothetical protein FB451DRAFT_1056159 [Mycena latifolia]|nr:hypothetical protein FB451DRAFT_1056159 [Mycena latifolia]